jgi:Zn-dependent peptidase ImmA (M78 family)
MYFALAKLLKSVPGLNSRALTEADFHKICRRERIKVVEMPLLVPGFYMVSRGRRFIVLDSRLRGVRWLHVAWHELAHHFLHAPKAAASVSFFQVREEPRVLFEAESFAAIALIPEPMLRALLAGEIEDEGYTREMVELRLKVLELYGV